MFLILEDSTVVLGVKRMRVATHAIVLREVNYKESDKILTLLTSDLGKLTVSARGCRKSRKDGSSISAISQLLVWSEVTLQEFRGRWSLVEGSTQMEFRHVRSDLDKLSLGAYLAELVENLVQEELPAPEILALLLNSLYALDTLNRPAELVKAAFELRLLSLAGYTPLLDSCVICGNEWPTEPRFHLREGVLHCKTCRVSEGISMPIEGGALNAMRHITECDGKKLFSFRLGEAGTKQLNDVCEAFLLTQLERGYKTLDFYKSLTIQP